MFIRDRFGIPLSTSQGAIKGYFHAVRRVPISLLPELRRQISFSNPSFGALSVFIRNISKMVSFS